jgi:UDP-N-acetylmuramate-alanine ligase
MLTKKFAQEICALVDFVAHLEVDESSKRFLRFNPTTEVMAKTRFRSVTNYPAPSSQPINFFESIVKPIHTDIANRNVSQTPPKAQQGKTTNPFNKGGSNATSPTRQL